MRSRLVPNRIENRCGGRGCRDDDVRNAHGSFRGLLRLGRQAHAAQFADGGVRTGRVAADHQHTRELSDAGDGLRLVGGRVAGPEQGQNSCILMRQVSVATASAAAVR